MKRRITARAIIVSDGKLLCAKLKSYKYSTLSDFWSVPGGEIEISETIINALNREIIEELGIQPKIGRLLYVQQYKDSDSEELEFFFHVENSSDFNHVDLSNTTHGEKEINEIKFIDPKQIYLLPDFLKTESLDFTGPPGPVKFFDYL